MIKTKEIGYTNQRVKISTNPLHTEYITKYNIPFDIYVGVDSFLYGDYDDQFDRVVFLGDCLDEAIEIYRAYLDELMEGYDE